MKWFLSIAVATGWAAVVVVLALALPRTSSGTRGDETIDRASPVCLSEPAWFAPIHKYYDCNPRITPDFDFASLCSGVVRGATVVPNSKDHLHRSK